MRQTLGRAFPIVLSTLMITMAVAARASGTAPTSTVPMMYLQKVLEFTSVTANASDGFPMPRPTTPPRPIIIETISRTMAQ